jgi:hypothetical protein
VLLQPLVQPLFDTVVIFFTKLTAETDANNIITGFIDYFAHV